MLHPRMMQSSSHTLYPILQAGVAYKTLLQRLAEAAAAAMAAIAQASRGLQASGEQRHVKQALLPVRLPSRGRGERLQAQALLQQRQRK